MARCWAVCWEVANAGLALDELAQLGGCAWTLLGNQANATAQYPAQQRAVAGTLLGCGPDVVRVDLATV
jgi:hypothetical protein